MAHGQNLSKDQFPQLPAKKGYSGYWNPDSLQNITSDITVVAVYQPCAYQVILPREQIGYTIHTTQSVLTYGRIFTFRVEVHEGYSDLNMVVKVNDVEIHAVDGVYTYPGVTSDLHVTVSGVADVAAPEAQIQIGESWWRKLLNSLSFNLFFKDNQKVAIEASDSGSGLYGIYYHIATDAVAEEELEKLQWLPYESAIYLEQEGSYVVYAKAVDNAGNALIINSEGIIIDRTAPALLGIENGGVYYGEVTVTVTDENIATVELDGQKVYDADSQEAVISHRIVLHPAENAQTLTVTDKAGNVSTMTVTVHEPEPEEPPVDPTEPTEPPKPTDPTEPTEPTKPVEPTEPTEPPKPTEPTDPTKPTDPVVTPEPEPDGTGSIVVIALVAMVVMGSGVSVLLLRKKRGR